MIVDEGHDLHRDEHGVWMFYDHAGQKWCQFINNQHYINTRDHTDTIYRIAYFRLVCELKRR